jgi:3'(2'), 5'-bisphosphate nucleotidase
MDDHARCAALAEAAGRLLLDVRAADTGADPRALKDRGDLDSDRLLHELLDREAPGDAVLSEERRDDGTRMDAERVWIIDPLDGTREFSEPGRDDWAVHVALVEGGELVAGAVALPAQGLVLSSGDDFPPLPALPAVPRLVVSRTRPPAFTEPVRAAVGGSLVPMGSAGAKAMAVVLGTAEVYAHGGGQFEWDSAAPVAVAAAAGLHVSRIDGSPLRYNQADPWLPDLLVCRPELAERVLDAVAAHAQAG